MENTRHNNLGLNDTHEDGQSSNPEITIAVLTERIAQIQEKVNDLTMQNAALQAACNPMGPLRNSETPLCNIKQSYTPTIVPPLANPENREESSHTDARRRGRNPIIREEGSSERTICKEANPKNLPQTKVEKKMTDLITKLE